MKDLKKETTPPKNQKKSKEKQKEKEGSEDPRGDLLLRKRRIAQQQANKHSGKHSNIICNLTEDGSKLHNITDKTSLIIDVYSEGIWIQNIDLDELLNGEKR